MTLLRKIGSYLLRALMVLISMVVLYVGIAGAGALIPTRPAKRNCPPTQEVFIVSNGLHLHIIFPAAELDSSWQASLQIPAQAQYVSFGWGDRAFYLDTPTWGDFRLSVGLRAAFLRSESALHVSYYHHAREDWLALQLCSNQADALMYYVQGSFARAAQQGLLPLEAPGYPARDRFYAAEGHYSILNTCNNWVNRGLKQAEVRTAIWAPFDWGVLRYLE